MHFIYILQLEEKYTNPNGWDEEANKVMGMHWNYLVDLHKQGIMEVVGRMDYEVDNPDLRGIAVFKAESLEKATDIMKNDPCVKYGVMKATVHPFNLALMKGVPHAD